jgi:hypothetical protein
VGHPIMNFSISELNDDYKDDNNDNDNNNRDEEQFAVIFSFIIVSFPI